MKNSFKVIVLILFTVLFITSCSDEDSIDMTSNTTQEPEETIDMTSNTTQESEETEKHQIETQEAIQEELPEWTEITEDGVNEELFWGNLDIEVLEAVAAELQALVKEEVEEERANPEIVLTEGWIRVFKSQHYEKVLNMGESAMKPLYWIIYKSPNAGTYEYICAAALYELSGYNFANEDGSLTWSNSKEFLERFNEQILMERKR